MELGFSFGASGAVGHFFDTHFSMFTTDLTDIY
jgi:hypothetical protein